MQNVQYKSGSIIYFAGDASKSIYILKKGIIRLTYTEIETGRDAVQKLNSGDFFGVKAALGKYPHEDTAQVVTDSIVLVLNIQEFEVLVKKNIQILMKMMRVYSNQLRNIGKNVRNILEKGEAKLPATELFNIGEYYFKNGQLQQALYAYRTYIKYYPDGQFVQQAKAKLENREYHETITKEPDLSLSSPKQAQAANEALNSSVLTEFALEEENLDTAIAEQEAAIQPEIPLNMSIGDKYYQGLTLISQKKFDKAQKYFLSILESKSFKNDAEYKFAEQAQFQVGMCKFGMDKYQEAMQEYITLIKKYPRSNDHKAAMFYIGVCHEELGNYKKAYNFYKKTLTMMPKGQHDKQAKSRIAELEKKKLV